MLQHVKNAIAATDVPSWVKSVPANFGDAATGTLKADEWQTLGIIYLPLALISLWRYWCRQASSNYEASHLHAYLDHTMLIISAIVIACKHTASERCSNDFLQCITSYLTDLQVLHLLQPFAVLKARHEKLPFLGTVCRIHIAHSIHVQSGWKLALELYLNSEDDTNLA